MKNVGSHLDLWPIPRAALYVGEAADRLDVQDEQQPPRQIVPGHRPLDVQGGQPPLAR